MTHQDDTAQALLTHPDEWVDLYGDYLYRYALTRLRDTDVAQDTVQETFLAALKARERFSGRSSEKTWMMGILKHKIIDRLRAKYRERPISELESETEDGVEDIFDRFEHWKEGYSSWETDPAKILENAEFWEVLEKCIKKAPERLSQAFGLRVIDGLSTEETCEILKVSPGNLNVMLYRARLRIRKCLEINWFA